MFVKKVLVLLIIVIASLKAKAEEMSVVDARRNIPLADNDPVFHDFYINAGSNNGLKNNLVVNVFRKFSIKDSSGVQNFGDAIVPVGQLKIIFVANKISIARLYKKTDQQYNPMLEQSGVMIGDHIEIKGSFVDIEKPKLEKVVEQQNPVAPVVSLTPAPAVVPTPTPTPAVSQTPPVTTSSVEKPVEIAKTAAAELPVVASEAAPALKQ